MTCGCASPQNALSFSPCMLSLISRSGFALGHFACRTHTLLCFLIDRMWHVPNQRTVVRVNVIGVSLPDSPAFVQNFVSSAQRPIQGFGGVRARDAKQQDRESERRYPHEPRSFRSFAQYSSRFLISRSKPRSGGS